MVRASAVLTAGCPVGKVLLDWKKRAASLEVRFEWGASVVWFLSLVAAFWWVKQRSHCALTAGRMGLPFRRRGERDQALGKGKPRG